MNHFKSAFKKTTRVFFYTTVNFFLSDEREIFVLTVTLRQHHKQRLCQINFRITAQSFMKFLKVPYVVFDLILSKNDPKQIAVRVRVRGTRVQCSKHAKETPTPNSFHTNTKLPFIVENIFIGGFVINVKAVLVRSTFMWTKASTQSIIATRFKSYDFVVQFE